MQRSPVLPAVATPSPVDSIGRLIRWQMMLAFGGVVALLTLLGYSTYNVTTVLVPDHGGVFREGVAGTPQYLNPLLCEVSAVDSDLCALIYRGLTGIDEHGRIVPDLADGWTITEDRVYTFRLRPNQFWHDGQPITADDVLFTIGILQDPEVYSLPYLANLWRAVQVEKVDDLTVRFSLSEPFTPFLSYTSIGLLPQHIWQDVPPAELATRVLTDRPIGNGPMRVVDLTNERIRLEPNPFASRFSPFLSALEFYFFPDQPSVFAAYADGAIDGVSEILLQDLPAATAREDLQIFSSIQPSDMAVLFNLQNPDTPFFQDKAVRQALYHGINRERLLADVASGQGILAHSLLLPEHWAYNPNVMQYDHDPGRARQLLDDAGWVDRDGDGVREKDGRPMEFLLTTNDDPVREALAERIALDWQEIGVRAIPTPVTFAGLVSDFLAPRRFDAALIGWQQVGDPDPYPLWHSTQATGGGQNYSGWDNEEADQLMEQARATISEAERKALYARFQELFAEDAPALLLYYPVYTYGVSDRVRNVQIGSLNNRAGRFDTFADWYILTRRVPANQVPASAPPTPPSGS